jgi:hypothetical protein
VLRTDAQEQVFCNSISAIAISIEDISINGHGSYGEKRIKELQMDRYNKQKETSNSIWMLLGYNIKQFSMDNVQYIFISINIVLFIHLFIYLIIFL